MRANTYASFCFILALVIASVTGCKQQDAPKASEAGSKTSPLSLTSTGFTEGSSLPARYTCDGANVSPPLRWSNLPQGTKSLALICDDPDAPGGVWVHWVLYNLPATTTELAEGFSAEAKLPGEAKQGTNDFKRSGYGGPCPPPGAPHRYLFHLYALDTALSLQGGATKQDLLRAMEGHLLAEGQLMGKYQRQ
jgi:Raf kinase inhibitor-like YbhB/YbcL family protein